MDYPIEIVRSDRTTVALEITKELTVRIRAPKHATDEELKAIAAKHEQWIQKHMEIQKRRMTARTSYDLTEEDSEALKAPARPDPAKGGVLRQTHGRQAEKRQNHVGAYAFRKLQQPERDLLFLHTHALSGRCYRLCCRA